MRFEWIIIGYAVLVVSRFFWRALKATLQEWLLRTEPTKSSWEEDLLLAHGIHGINPTKSPTSPPLRR